MTGGLMQLVACGAQDIFLTGSPLISYFKMIYRRHTNFAIDTIQQTFASPAGFGKRVSSELTRNGDLICGAYIKATLPDLTEKNSTNFSLNSNGVNLPNRRYMRWIDNIGHYLIREVSVEIGGKIIDAHYGEWLEIWSQLTVPAGQIEGYRKMIGQDKKNAFGQNTGLQADVISSIAGKDPAYSTTENIIIGRDIFIPLQFWFCRNIGLALPLIALQYNVVKINVEFRTADELVLVYSGDVAQESGVPTGWSSTTESFVSYSFLEVSLWIDYVFLDADERRRFAQVSHEYLIEQVQVIEDSATQDEIKTIPLSFSHPVKELIWVSTAFKDSKEYSNFTDTQLPLEPPFETTSVDTAASKLITGLTGLPDETYIDPSKLTIKIENANDTIDGATLNYIDKFIVGYTIGGTFSVVNNYVMKEDDIITVNYKSLDGVIYSDTNYVLRVKEVLNGTATSFYIDKPLYNKSIITYNNVISIVRMAYTPLNSKLSLRIVPTVFIAPGAEINLETVGPSGVFNVAVNTGQDYQMKLGDIIQVCSNNNIFFNKILTVTNVVDNIATSFTCNEYFIINEWNTVMSIRRSLAEGGNVLFSSQLFSAVPNGLDTISTYDQLMKFSNYDSVRPYNSVTGLAGNPILKSTLTINGNNRFETREGGYFNRVQPLDYHTNIPESPGINVYSFSLNPEKHQPSGTCNFSRISTAKLILELGKYYRDSAEINTDLNIIIRIYAVNYNILRIVSGMAGLAYNS